MDTNQEPISYRYIGWFVYCDSYYGRLGAHQSHGLSTVAREL